MDMKVAKNISTQRVIPKPCHYWLAGRCNRNPCRFLHEATPHTFTASCNVNAGYHSSRKRHSSSESEKPLPKRNSKTVLIRKSGDGGDRTPVAEASQKPSPIICKYWMDENCVYGDHCRYLHSWFYGDALSTLTKLQGHKKLVTGITLPVGSNKLYSGSTDGTLRTWDCHSGKCDNVMNLGAEVTSLISEGPWIFVGLPNIIKAWNLQTASQFTLDGPKGRILAMVVGKDTLLAGAEDGVISAWRVSSEPSSSFEMVASLHGHTKSVVCLTIGCRKMLYSGSMDQTIKVWNLDTFECTMTLHGHTGAVTSLICWDNFLLSGSSDCTIKIWAATEEGPLKVIYSQNVENVVIALNGMTDAEGKHILFCSCKDNSVRLYELPSFSERGRLFARREFGSIEIGSGGLFFTGDGTGLMTVWKWLEDPKLAGSS
ncbi:zinc finger CCCH domain-containing protein 17-like [Cicer arietinum]|uniref:Zinc finger CCCH domain-containing protein 48-like n=1 Tax=Cicer arietinum TaxID=3827 RepID=A0A1S2YW57_CICAR|nr:zinc finger CCCH domain-containing protein 48-like [Cicer arietinum]